MDMRMMEAVGSGKVAVELGCGSGQILNDLAGRFDQRIGIDISRRRLDKLVGRQTNGWEFREADLNELLPLERESTDVVIANQVIEHIVNPFHFVQEIHRVLRPGKCCVITTPNIRYIRNIMHIILSGYGPRTAGGNMMDGAWDDGHLHYFTHKDLQELFRNVGFRMVQSRAFIDLTGGSLIRRLMSQYAKSLVVREFLSGCIFLVAEK
jgi:methionine biosynthesis protein MetW